MPKKRHFSEKDPAEPTRSSPKTRATAPKPQNDASARAIRELQDARKVRELRAGTLEKARGSQRTESYRTAAAHRRSRRMKA